MSEGAGECLIATANAEIAWARGYRRRQAPRFLDERMFFDLDDRGRAGRRWAGQGEARQGRARRGRVRIF